MYIFGDPSQELSASKLLTADVPRALKVSKSQNFYTPEYYNRVYERLLSVSKTTFTPKVFQHKLTLGDSLISSKSSLLNDPQMHFILGQKMAQLLNDEENMLDREARVLLHSTFEKYGIMHLRIKGVNYYSWRDFADFGTPDSTANSIECGMKISSEDMNESRKVIRGKMAFLRDRWGLHPVLFTPYNFIRNNSLNITVAGLNSILTDRFHRRIMAEEYLDRPNSKVISKDTFQEAMEIILPFVPKNEKHDPSVFDPLCGGRTPVDTHLVFLSSNSKLDSVRIKVIRCRICGVPLGMKHVLAVTDNQVRTTKGTLNLHTAIQKASLVLSTAHKSTGC